MQQEKDAAKGEHALENGTKADGDADANGASPSANGNAASKSAATEKASKAASSDKASKKH